MPNLCGAASNFRAGDGTIMKQCEGAEADQDLTKPQPHLTDPRSSLTDPRSSLTDPRPSGSGSRTLRKKVTEVADRSTEDVYNNGIVRTPVDCINATRANAVTAFAECPIK